jgi:hypothetical protein
MQTDLELPNQEGILVPPADREWDIFINTWTMNTANCLRIPLAGSNHLFATSARELTDSLDPTSCMFANNLTKVIFLVEHLPKHHSVLSKVGAFHDAFIQDVVRQNTMPGISQADAKVSSRSGKALSPKIYSVPAFVKHKLRTWRNNIHRSIFRKYKFQCRFSNKNTNDGLTVGFYNSNRRSRADSVYYLRWYRPDAKRTNAPTSSEKVSCRGVPDLIIVPIY